MKPRRPLGPPTWLVVARPARLTAGGRVPLRVTPVDTFGRAVPAAIAAQSLTPAVLEVESVDTNITIRGVAAGTGTVRLTTGTGASQVTRDITVTVAAAPAPTIPVVTLGAVTPNPASEGQALAATVSLSGPAPAGGTTGTFTWDGDPGHSTPLDAADYQGARTGTWTVAAGQTTAAIGAQLADDVAQEGAEGGRLTITVTSGGTAGATLVRTFVVNASDQPTSVTALSWDEASKRRINAGGPFWLDVLALRAGNTAAPAGDLTITSSNPAVVAAPADPGPVGGSLWREIPCKALAAGTTTITVTAGGLTLSQEVTVVAGVADQYRHGLTATAPRTYDANGVVDGNLVLDPATNKLVGPHPGMPGRDAPWPVARPAVVNATTLQPTANVADNRNALLAAISARAAMAQGGRIYLNGGSWGDQIAVLNPQGSVSRQIVIADDRYRTGTFPRAEGVDVTLADGADMPTFTSTTTLAAVFLGKDAKWVRFMGCRFNCNQDGQVRAGGLISSRETNSDIISTTNEADYPRFVTFEQCVVDGLGAGRGAWVNGVGIAWLNCRIDRVNGPAPGDRQGLNISQAGPYYFRDGYMACNGGETITVGSGASVSRHMVPHDIWLDGTILSGYDLNTVGSKNVAECKGVRRWANTNYIVANFYFTNFGGQAWHFIFKTAAEGSQLVNYARDIIMRGGLHTNTSGSAVVFLNADVRGESSTSRVDCSHIVMTNPMPNPPTTGAPITTGSMFVLDNDIVYKNPASSGFDTTSGANEPESQRLRDVAIHHNTYDNGPVLRQDAAAFIYYAGDGDFGEAKSNRIEVRGNVDARRDSASFKGALLLWFGKAGTQAEMLTALATRGCETTTTNRGRAGSIFAGNVHNSGPGLAPGNTSLANYAAFQLGANGAPNAGSPVLTADVDGGRAGADPALVPALRAF